MITLKDLEEHGFEQKAVFNCSVSFDWKPAIEAKEYVMINWEDVRIVLYIAEGEEFARKIGYENGVNMPTKDIDALWTWETLTGFLRQEYEARRKDEIQRYRKQLKKVREQHRNIMGWLKKAYGRFTDGGYWE